MNSKKKQQHTIVPGFFQGCSPAGSLDQLFDVEWLGSDLISVRGCPQREVLIKLNQTFGGEISQWYYVLLIL